MAQIRSAEAQTRRAWQGMIRRCYNPKDRDQARMKALGITVCDRWHPDNPQGFDNFLADMGPRPENATLSRVSEQVGFIPNNVVWKPKVRPAESRLYSIWKGMKRRCSRRGTYPGHIDIFPDWEDNFAVFSADVGLPPSDEHTLDRIDNGLGYWPGNVRWASKREQARNRIDNVFIEMFGERRTLQEWCDIFDVDRQTVSSRWVGLFAPAKKKKKVCAQIDVGTGETIATFDSVRSAANATGIGYSAISRCACGMNNTAGGFAWKYTED